jgi:hypothetical protein
MSAWEPTITPGGGILGQGGRKLDLTTVTHAAGDLV